MSYENMMMNGQEFFERILQNLEKVVRGKTEVLRNLITCFLSSGNVLLEDVPGVGKTTLAKSLAQSVGGDFKRVQFTPDLLPTDILGSSIYSPKDEEFHFKKGPVFGNILLADEINRASPRTQSSLLEAMSERQVTIEGHCYKLPEPFLVLATQNPVEFHGTYPLPEAQLDRFWMRLSLGYPEMEAELEILESQKRAHPLESLEAVVTVEEVLEATAALCELKVETRVSEYILALVAATRKDSRLKLGSSTRGALALYRVSQARAFSEGRDYVLPDDVKALASSVLAHRLVLETKAKYAGTTKDAIMRELLEKVPVPT